MKSSEIEAYAKAVGPVLKAFVSKAVANEVAELKGHVDTLESMVAELELALTSQKNEGQANDRC